MSGRATHYLRRVFRRVHGHSVPKHQRPLNSDEKQYLKAVAMQREVNKQMSGIVVGREGFSPNILGHITKILANDQLVRVTMMLTCRMDQIEVRDQMQDMTDSVLVLGMGLNLFFYRNNKLPPLPYTIGPRPWRKPR